MHEYVDVVAVDPSLVLGRTQAEPQEQPTQQGLTQRGQKIQSQELVPWASGRGRPGHASVSGLETWQATTGHASAWRPAARTALSQQEILPECRVPAWKKRRIHLIVRKWKQVDLLPDLRPG